MYIKVKILFVIFQIIVFTKCQISINDLLSDDSELYFFLRNSFIL